jgi:hypothetical protein
MYFFSQTDKTSVALTLIENGANMQLQDNEGNTALGTSLPRPTLTSGSASYARRLTPTPLAFNAMQSTRYATTTRS